MSSREHPLLPVAKRRGLALVGALYVQCVLACSSGGTGSTVSAVEPADGGSGPPVSGSGSGSGTTDADAGSYEPPPGNPIPTARG